MNPAPGVFLKKNTNDGGLTFVCRAATRRHQGSMLLAFDPYAQSDPRFRSSIRRHPLPFAASRPLFLWQLAPGTRLNRTDRHLGVFRIADLGERQALRRHHLEFAGARLVDPEVGEAPAVELALPH